MLWIAFGVFVAIGLLVVVAAVRGPDCCGYWTSPHHRHIEVKSDIHGITSQLKRYHSNNGFFPTTEQGLNALVVQPTSPPVPARWEPLYRKVPEDPWRRPYIYRCPGRKNTDSFDLFSTGSDGIADTADDDWGK